MSEQQIQPPYGSEQTFTLHRCEEKKKLDSGMVVWTVGVEAPNGWKGYAETFAKEKPSGSITGTLEAPSNPQWAPKLKAKKTGGWGGGGGGRRGDDPETRSSIEGQVAAKLLTELVVAGAASDAQRAALDGWIAERVS